jgi:hypothetical protein
VLPASDFEKSLGLNFTVLRDRSKMAELLLN